MSLFIVIDGGDGTGKTTQIKLLKEYLDQKDIDTIVTKEPGGSPAGSVIREMLISKSYNLEPLAETLLYYADRVEHLEKVIIPNSKAGKVVICDRFEASTYAYQHFGRQIDINIIDSLYSMCVSKKPDITIILDIPPEISLKRAKNRLESANLESKEGKFEALGLGFHEKVQRGFMEYSRKNPNSFIIDANKDIHEVHECIVKKIQSLL